MGCDNSPMNKLVDLMPGLIDKVNGFIVKRKDKKETHNKTADNMTGDCHDNN